MFNVSELLYAAQHSASPVLDYNVARTARKRYTAGVISLKTTGSKSIVSAPFSATSPGLPRQNSAAAAIPIRDDPQTATPRDSTNGAVANDAEDEQVSGSNVHSLDDVFNGDNFCSTTAPVPRRLLTVCGTLRR